MSQWCHTLSYIVIARDDHSKQRHSLYSNKPSQCPMTIAPCPLMLRRCSANVQAIAILIILHCIWTLDDAHGDVFEAGAITLVSIFCLLHGAGNAGHWINLVRAAVVQRYHFLPRHHCLPPYVACYGCCAVLQQFNQKEIQPYGIFTGIFMADFGSLVAW